MKTKNQNNGKVDTSGILSWNLRVLVYGPVFLALVILILSVVIADIVFNTTIPYKIGGIIIGLCSIVAGLGGVPQIIRREMPGLFFGTFIRGTLPVIMGILQIVMFCGGGLVVIVATLIDYY